MPTTAHDCAFFLSRATPMWFILALAICGLRYTSQFAVKE
jgi:hypothetical protein